MGTAPWVLVVAVAVGALADPPETVVLEGRSRAVVFHHRAHVARRIACRTCHGEGVITKIGHLGMTAGHERCRGCHEQAQRGPTACAGCHSGAKPKKRGG